MRILVDQSGYDLLNLGDAAMLQACVSRLRSLWPDAAIEVVCHAPERLSRLCPDTVPVGHSLADRSPFHHVPRRARLGGEQLYKMGAPYLVPARQLARIGTWAGPLLESVEGADLVVGSGGGYLTDAFWWHGSGVLSLLDLAQRRGTPTVMFGQQVGPVRHRVLRAQARRVLPRLVALGLREGVVGPRVARELGVRSDRTVVTGDDALEMCVPDQFPRPQDALGLNLRVARYTGLTPALASVVASVVARSGAPVVSLPISQYETSSDGHDTA